MTDVAGSAIELLYRGSRLFVGSPTYDAGQNALVAFASHQDQAFPHIQRRLLVLIGYSMCHGLFTS